MMNAKRSSKFKLTRYAFVVPAVVVLLLVFTLSKADVAKPITHKIALTIKPVTTAIKQAAQTAMAFADTVPAKKAKTFAGKVIYTDTVKFDTVRYKKPLTFSISSSQADTGKYSKLMVVREANKHVIDSMNIILNGKKVDNVVFSKVDPSTIESINIYNKEALKLTPIENYTFNNDKEILFIATKDSPEGKALAEKLGKNRQVTNIHVNTPAKTVTSSFGLLNAVPATKGDVKNITIVTHGRATTIPADDIQEIVLDSGVVRVRGVKKQGVSGIQYNVRKEDGSANAVSFISPGYVTATATYSEATPGKDVLVKGLRANNRYVYTTGVASVDRISDKLIVIDGKIASEKELKKLSAFDIDRMSTSNSADTVKKYGDKAKYGVVYIYTKKGKQ